MKKHKVLIVSALEVETQGKLNTWDTLYTGVGKVNDHYFTKLENFGLGGEFVAIDKSIQKGERIDKPD